MDIYLQGHTLFGEQQAEHYHRGTDTANPGLSATVTAGNVPPPPPPNSGPSTGDTSADMDAGESYTFTTGDFPFDDADGDPLDAVIIDSLPEIGILSLNGDAVVAGQSIEASDIAAGGLVYMSHMRGADADFVFRVSDGSPQISDSARFTLAVSDPDGLPPLVGTPRSDSLIGGDRDEFIWGRADNDVKHGAGGADRLGGSIGHDTINGGTGSDLLFGSDGDDVLWGGLGHDILFSGDGDDTLTGGTGSDSFTFGRLAGNDRIADFVTSDDILDLRYAARDFDTPDDVLATAIRP
ncbi:calcium-binding protein [Eilatimonas milleporae]|nr:hypothetical protein [Eilatimonas milleporae]